MSDIVRDPYGNPLNRDKLITALRAENEGLRVALKETASDFEMSLQIDKQKDAEIERLRAALGDIHAAAGNNHLIANIARAALEVNK